MPILVPLFISAFRRADELATAMECRCYHGGEGRTKLHVLQYQRRDYVALAGGVVILALVVVTAETWHIKLKKRCRHKRCKGNMLCAKGAVL